MEIPCSSNSTENASRLRSGVRTALAILVVALVTACDDPIPPEPTIVAASMTISPSSFDLVEGGSVSFTASVSDATGNPLADAEVAWNSSDRNVISVTGSGASATITAIGPGQATIWAAAGTATASAMGTVLAADGFQAAIQPLFTANCAFGGCHGPPANRVGLNLSEGAAYDLIVRVPAVQLSSMNRIEPYDPDNSYLVQKLLGSDVAVGGFRQRMPRGGAPLSQADIDAVIKWVKTGARNN